ncbi:uncharacterized protein [Typha latifolia]|uniref:uncharacterized protein n=1 Tax=Typha latifolia TaxID=4733 RepID=UPI003C2FBE20
MYPEAGLEFPFFPGFAQDGGTHLDSMMQSSMISGYDLGGEGDLFKAPELILEEPVLPLDPMAAAMSIISGGDDVITESMKVSDIESIQNDLLSDVFYDCKKDLLEESAIEESISELLDVKISAVQIEEVAEIDQHRFAAEGPLQKSVSSGCLNSMDWNQGRHVRPNFLGFQGLDFDAELGMRRAYSEGDIQNLGNSNTSNGSTVPSSFECLLTINDLKSEERRQKLSRYRKKKSKRNFGRKIKYACRKALADSQPRVRGRFAKTEDREISKSHM